MLIPTNKKNRTHVPMRTCVGCRQRAAKRDLMRVVAHENEIALDLHQRKPGRGAYVHQQAVCVTAAVKRGGLSRSFRRRVDSAALEQILRSTEEGQS